MILGQGDRVAQLRLDGGLRGAERGLQVGVFAMPNVQLCSPQALGAGSICVL